MLFTDTSTVEPRRNCIILTLSTTDCLIMPNQLVFILRQDTDKLVDYLLKNFVNYRDTPDFELTALELILDFIIEEFNQQFEASKSQIDKLQKEISPNQVQLFAEKLQINSLNNDITVTAEALDNLLDDDDDVLALSFKNQKLMKNFVCKSKRQQQSIKQSNKQNTQNSTQLTNQNSVQSIIQQVYQQPQQSPEASTSVLSLYDYEQDTIKYVYEVPMLSLFLQRNLYQLHSTQISTQSYCNKIQSIIEVQQIKVNTIRNNILNIQAYSEIVCTSICIMNTIAVIFGANLDNPWYPTDDYTTLVPFYVLTGLIFLIGIGYIVIYSLIFRYNYNKIERQ